MQPSHSEVRLFFGYKNCSTCKKAEKALQTFGVAYEFTDITLNPPDRNTLKHLIDTAGLPLKKWFNTSGQVYRELNLKDRLTNLSQEEAIALLADNGRLIKRPLVYQGSKVTLGFHSETFAQTWQI